jgi:hypothetical protein
MRGTAETIYLNEQQLLEVQELVARLEKDLEWAEQVSDPLLACRARMDLEMAREVLDRCLAYAAVGQDH